MIKDRKLKVGMKLVARHKGTDYNAVVVKGEKGGTAIRMNRKTYSGLSSAGNAITGWGSTNGWKFWSVKGQESESRRAKRNGDAPATEKPAKKKRTRVASAPAPNPESATFKLLEDGRFYCEACATPFIDPQGAEQPERCPEGHTPDGVKEEAIPAPAATG